ncbi:uncharacterized protein LOC115641673 [Gopherus evgoodei]|uniref:uncharacterized protein LOC115641673 n=1 Tax=Gopherus evgoodei TaxID=1825980 RepID=UPI0011CF7BB3|nr:uncharacterized protein LOC115641673 [Gopherus evgoodei]
MDSERPGSAPLPCTLQPSSEPGFVPLPFFLRHDSPVSWDLCAPIPAAESLDSWESGLLWDGRSLVIANSSRGQPGMPGGAGSISPQPPLDLSGFPLAKPWDILSPDAPADAAPDFVHPLVAAAHLDPRASWLMSTINPAGFTPPLPPLDPAGFPSPELWTGAHMDAPPDAAPDPALPPVAAACLDPTDIPPTSKSDPDLGEVLAHVSDTLRCHPKGMRVKPLIKRLRKEHGVDLLAFSQDGGYRGVVSFLQEMPGIELWNPEKGEKCRVLSCTFKKNITDPLPLLCSTLGSFPNGLRVFSLRKAMWQRHGVNLEEFSQQQGYLSTLDYLTRLRGIRLQGLERGEKCLVQLQKGEAVKPPAPQPPPDPAPPLAQHSSSPLLDAPANGGQTGAPGEMPGLAEVSAWVRDVLGRFPLGLKVGKLKEALRSEHGLDLEELSRQRGCGDALHLLQALPHLWLRDPDKGDACLARLDAGEAVTPPAPQPPPGPAPPSARHSSSPPPDAPANGGPMGTPGETPGLAEVSAWVRDVLGRFPLGLKVGKLKEALRSEHGLDLEELSRQRGCGDALHLLQALPHLWLRDPDKGDACLARLDADAAVNAPAPSQHAEAGGLGAVGPARRTQGQHRVAKPGAMEMLIRGALAPYPFGIRVKNLRKVLAGKHGAELEAFRQARGYRDVVSFLRDVPGLTLRGPERGNNCIVQLQRGATEVLTLLKCLLRPHKSGLQLQKVQELMLERHGLDLKGFVSSQGKEDVLGYLQRHLPTLKYRRPEKGAKCIVWLGTGQKKGFGSLPPGSARPLPGSKRCLLPTNAAERPPPPATDCLNPRLPSATTNQPLLPSLPSGREPFRAPAVLGKLRKSPGANPRLPAWLLSPPRPTGACSGLRTEEGTQESGARPTSAPLILRTEEGTQESGARPASAPLVLRAEEGTQESGAQPPEDLMELKRKVGAILAGHPGGMSLFQFRAAYSAAHQHPLPLGRTASTKQRLAQMPDVVRMQGCGVQMLLLPVDPDEPPGAEPGLTLWIPQEAAALVGDSDDPAEPPPAPAVPDPAGDPDTPTEPPSTLAEIPLVLTAPALTGDPNTLIEPTPALGEIPLVLTAPALTGDPNTPAEPPFFPAAPAPAGDPDTLTEPTPTLGEIPLVLTAPAPAGYPDTPAEPPPVPAAPNLTGYPDTPAEPPPVPAAPAPAGYPDTPAEPPPVPAAPNLTGDPDTPAEPSPILPEILPVLTAPNPAGDPRVPVKPPPTFVAPRWGPSPQALQCPEAAGPEANWELPALVPSAPVVLPASGPGSSSWFWLGAESPPAPAPAPAPADPGAAACPVVYPPPQEVPPASSAGPKPPSLCPAAPGPPQARLRLVQLVPPFQDHAWAGDAPRAQPVPKALDPNQGTSAAVGSPVGPIPAAPSMGQVVSPAKQLPGVAPAPLPPPDASGFVTPERGWPDAGRPGSGGDIGSSVDPSLRCHPAQPVPSAGRTQLGPRARIPSAPPTHSPQRHTDTCVLL